jgi:hypothetical protein
MTEHQRRRRLLMIERRARALELIPSFPDPDLHRELEVAIAADPHAAASQWFASQGFSAHGRGNTRYYGRPFWRGRW